MISELCDVGTTGWYLDSSGWAAVGVINRGLTLDNVEIVDGFVAVTVGDAVRVHSYYAPQLCPSISISSSWVTSIAL